MIPEVTSLDKRPVANSANFGETVPVIDIAALMYEPDDRSVASTVEEIARACKSWGFFQIVNHGISSEQIGNVWRHTQKFFNAATETKNFIIRSKDNPWGYYNNELTKNQRDKKEIFDFTSQGVDSIYGAENKWPAGDAEFKTTMLDYFEACTNLSLKLLGAFCAGLSLSEDYLHNEFDGNHTGFMRLNYYPVDDPLDEPTVEHQIADLGVHHHTDAGAFTVLLQDEVSGLQVYRDGYWHNILPIKDAFVINTGDMMQVWSNDIYQAAIHRGLAMEDKERYSIPFFFNPAGSTRVSPLSTVVSKTRPERYHEIKWQEFRGRRSEGDYADYGSEVQISQYKIT